MIYGFKKVGKFSVLGARI